MNRKQILKRAKLDPQYRKQIIAKLQKLAEKSVFAKIYLETSALSIYPSHIQVMGELSIQIPVLASSNFKVIFKAWPVLNGGKIIEWKTSSQEKGINNLAAQLFLEIPPPQTLVEELERKISLKTPKFLEL